MFLELGIDGLVIEVECRQETCLLLTSISVALGDTQKTFNGFKRKLNFFIVSLIEAIAMDIQALGQLTGTAWRIRSSSRELGRRSVRGWI